MTESRDLQLPPSNLSIVPHPPQPDNPGASRSLLLFLGALSPLPIQPPSTSLSASTCQAGICVAWALLKLCLLEASSSLACNLSLPVWVTCHRCCNEPYMPCLLRTQPWQPLGLRNFIWFTEITVISVIHLLLQRQVPWLNFAYIFPACFPSFNQCLLSNYCESGAGATGVNRTSRKPCTLEAHILKEEVKYKWLGSVLVIWLRLLSQCRRPGFDSWSGN